MKLVINAAIAISLCSTSAVAQVRPQDCRPIFPVVDQVAAVPQDIIAEPVAPVATASRRAFFGLPLWLPLLLAGGGALIIATSDDDDDDPVSPA